MWGHSYAWNSTFSWVWLYSISCCRSWRITCSYFRSITNFVTIVIIVVIIHSRIWIITGANLRLITTFATVFIIIVSGRGIYFTPLFHRNIISQNIRPIHISGQVFLFFGICFIVHFVLWLCINHRCALDHQLQCFKNWNPTTWTTEGVDIFLPIKSLLISIHLPHKYVHLLVCFPWYYF